MKLGGWWAQRLSSRFAFPVVDHFDPVTGAAGWQASNPPPLLLATLSASLEVWSEAGLQRIVDKAELLTLYVSLSLSVSRCPSASLCLLLLLRTCSPGPQRAHPLLGLSSRLAIARLCRYTQSLLENSAGLGPDVVQVVTPTNPWRGAQLSIRLLTAGALGDDRIDGGGEGETVQGSLEAVHAWLGGRGVVCDLRRPDMLRFAPAPLYNTFEETHAFVGLLREALAVA